MIIGSYMVLNVTYRSVQILESLIIFNNHNNNHNNSKFTDLASEPTCSLYNSNGSAKTLRNGLWGVSKWSNAILVAILGLWGIRSYVTVLVGGGQDSKIALKRLYMGALEYLLNVNRISSVVESLYMIFYYMAYWLWIYYSRILWVAAYALGPAGPLPGP